MTPDLAVKDTGKPRILIAPLDWGLGHATRCIPLIYELLKEGGQVWIAGEGAQELVLKKEFPNLSFLTLKGYRVAYGNPRLGIIKSIILQVPRILTSIRHENAWLKKAVEQYHFDFIISDNRYGFYHPQVPCAIVTHQLSIKTGGKWSDQFIQKLNYRFINRFSQCWIPDEEKEYGWAGELSHPHNLPAIPVHYLGILSRLKKLNNSVKKNHLFISLSGPEPQRTQLENIIIKDIVHYGGSACIVRGMPASTSLIPSTNDIRFYNHLPTEEYNTEMQCADYVISRSGYSTVMDILRLGKKSILIATPGQTEQEYIARHLTQRKIAFALPQENFSLPDALQLAGAFDYAIKEISLSPQLSSTIQSFLHLNKIR